MWTLEKFKPIYARYQSGSLRVRDFCRNEGIAESKFYYWKRQLDRTCQLSDQFVPVLLSTGSHPSTVNTPASNTRHPFSSIPAGGCEIIYPDGTILRLSGFSDISLLKTLLPLIR